MDASSGAPDRDQCEDPEWHAAVQLVGLCVPVTDSAAAAIQLVSLSVPVAESPNSSAAAAASEVSTKNDADGTGKDKEFKKPDTILPCACCNSMRTKFCYFNNYNANQPRHYCKDCKRYWTHGGTLTDVPIVSARRKNRNMPSGANNGDAGAGASRCRSRVFKPLAIPGPLAEESAAATTAGVFNLVLGKSLCPTHYTKEQKSTTDLVGSGDNKEDKSCLSSSVATFGSSENFGSDSVAAITTSAQFSIDGAHESVNSGVNRLLPMPPTLLDLRIRAPDVQFPHALVYWSRIPSSPNGASSVPWARSGGTTSPPIPTGGDSLALGKHPREHEEAEKIFWVPKALRVTDPEDAAKSTIWASLGIEPDERILG